MDNDFEDKLNQSDELELNSVRNVTKQDKYQFNENHIKDLKKEFYNVGKETEVNMNEFKSLQSHVECEKMQAGWQFK